MKERGILFGAPMVRALLAGTKTQTRRVIKPMRNVPLPIGGNWLFTGLDEHGFSGLYEDHGPLGQSACPLPRCPYGVPGDHLWVRETWRAPHRSDVLAPSELRPDRRIITYEAGGGRGDDRNYGKTRVSIHMPRWASRITLEVIEIRVQRLQDISEEDARAEGVEPDADCLSNRCRRPYFDRYMDLWGEINGKDSWKLNPWVWAISFRMLP